jgi:hypothetical protein
MKKQLLLTIFAVACATAHAESSTTFYGDTSAASHAETSSSKAASTVSSAVKTELMGFDTESYGGQEVRVAVTKETTAGASAFCRQYVQSYTHEIAAADNTNGSLPVDKTTIVLGNECKWTKG